LFGLRLCVAVGDGHGLWVGVVSVVAAVVVSVLRDESHFVRGNHTIVVCVLTNEGSLLGEGTTWADWDSNWGVVITGLGWAWGWVLGNNPHNGDTTSDHLRHRCAARALLVNRNRFVCRVWLLNGVRNLLVHVDVNCLGHLLGYVLVLGDWPVCRVWDNLGDLDGERLGYVTGAWYMDGLVRGNRLHAILAVLFRKRLGKGLRTTIAGSTTTIHDTNTRDKHKKTAHGELTH